MCVSYMESNVLTLMKHFLALELFGDIFGEDDDFEIKVLHLRLELCDFLRGLSHLQVFKRKLRGLIFDVLFTLGRCLHY